METKSSSCFVEEHVRALHALCSVPCPEPVASRQAISQENPVFVEAEQFLYEQQRQAQQQTVSLLACLVELKYGADKMKQKRNELRRAMKIHQVLKYHQFRTAYSNLMNDQTK